jgi:high-affinity iron transporter
MEELGQKYELPAPAATKTQLVRGKIVYVRLCSSCHGVDGKGNGVTAKQLEIKPPDLTDVEQAGFFSEQARLHIIRKGVTGTPMIGWENVLSEDDILAVFFYVRSLAFPVSNRQTGGGSS